MAPLLQLERRISVESKARIASQDEKRGKRSKTSPKLEPPQTEEI
jgi:hypothetical protein